MVTFRSQMPNDHCQSQWRHGYSFLYRLWLMVKNRFRCIFINYFKQNYINMHLLCVIQYSSIKYWVHKIYYLFTRTQNNSVTLHMCKNHSQCTLKLLQYFKDNEIDVYFWGELKYTYWRIWNVKYLFVRRETKQNYVIMLPMTDNRLKRVYRWVCVFKLKEISTLGGEYKFYNSCIAAEKETRKFYCLWA